MGKVGNCKVSSVFDPHVHGGGGYSFASRDPEEIVKAYRAHKKHGTTHVLATYVILPFERLALSLKALREAMKEEKGILGAYIEGPFINPEKSGGMRKDYITCWSLEEFKRLIEEFADVIRVITLAPEVPEAERALEIALKNGIKASIGHTRASYEKCMQFIEKGCLSFTHIYNAMEPFHHRNPGPVAAALLSDVFCEIIPEKHHIHPAALKLAYKVKKDKLIFISDATALSAGGPKSMRFSGQVVHSVDGACLNEEGKLFGSAITLTEGIKWASSILQVSPENLLKNNAVFLSNFTDT